jgi:sulfopyruvate decarboxylase subunit alpha
MDEAAKHPAVAELRTLSGAAIVTALKDAGIDYVISVPDQLTARGILRRVEQDQSLNLVRVCKEDECLGIAAGLTYGHHRPLILIQYTGFQYAINAIRGIACEQKLPIVMMIGLLAKEPDVLPRQSKKFGVAITEPMLELLGIEQHYIDTDADVGKIRPVIEKAYATSRAAAFLIGRAPA